jgi:phosphatidylglycerophosphatase A
MKSLKNTLTQTKLYNKIKKRYLHYDNSHSTFVRPPMDWRIFFLSFGGVGFMKPAAGTWGTLATIPFLYLFTSLGIPSFFFIPMILLMTGFAVVIAEIVQRELKVHDPSWIVIDEVVGVSTAWLFLYKHSIASWIALFVIFRFFDIVKIWPANYLDEKVTHGAGTILDDNVSGIYTGIVLLLLQYLNII